MNIIQLERISKNYISGTPVLDELSLSVNEGSIFGFLGLNGAGKTTTIKILAGLLRADAGTTRLFGNEVRPGDKEFLRSIGFVMDEPLYFEWMTGAEYLEFVGTMYGLDEATVEARTEELLAFFDLEERGVIATYSTGMKKKISLAAAIMHKPRLVILDEPLEGIDAVTSSAIKEILAMMAARGTTVFITSHVLDTVERFCTEVAIIHQGKLLLQSPIGEIHSQAKHLVGEREFKSLEHLFVELVSAELRGKRLSFLTGDTSHER
jgi:ABC-2 type transport system ATP-binding protein